jgi:hypothetical protein
MAASSSRYCLLYRHQGNHRALNFGCVVESHHYREYECAHCHPYKNGTQVCGHLTSEEIRESARDF